MQPISSFRTSESGSVAIIFALVITSILGCLSLAIDMARAYSVQTRIAQALDAAAIAGAKALDEGDSDSEINMTANAHFDSAVEGMRGVTVQRPITLTIQRSTANVSASTNATISTMFARVLGHDSILVARAATVNVRTRHVELAMALDVTGSMQEFPQKLADLKVAAKDVVDVLFDGAKSDSLVRISIVPWSASVNAGSVAGMVSGGMSADQCVVERLGADELTDAAPYGSSNVRALDVSTVGYTCPTSPVIPLSGRNQRTQLKTAIEALQGAGATGGHMGAAWGWYTLSPAWGSVWATTGAQPPRPYAPAETIKNVLIMTDGEFNVSWKTASAFDEATAPLMVEESYSTFRQLCDKMKVEKINIFTVGFGLNNPRAIIELGACASSSTQAFNAVSGTELKKAFKDIAMMIKRMRITH